MKSLISLDESGQPTLTDAIRLARWYAYSHYSPRFRDPAIDVDDIAQGALIALVRGIKQTYGYDNGDALPISWQLLRVVLRRKVISEIHHTHILKRVKCQSLDDGFDNESGIPWLTDYQSSQRINARLTLMDVWLAIPFLTLRQAIMLEFLTQEKTQGEIAEITDINQSAVSVHLRQTRSRLQRFVYGDSFRLTLQERLSLTRASNRVTQ